MVLMVLGMAVIDSIMHGWKEEKKIYQPGAAKHPELSLVL